MKTKSLVLIHGYPFDHAMWYGVIAALGAGTRVFAPDLRGFGNTELGPEEPALEVMADDLEAMLKAQGVEKTVVAGMSMGGYVALAYAERYPARLAGLGLVNTQAGEDSEEGRSNRRSLIAKIKKEGTGAALQAILPKLFSPDQTNNEDLIAIARQAAETAGIQGLTWALEAMARRPDRSDLLKKLDIPVSVIHSSEDKIIPPAKARAMAELCRKPHYFQIRGAGHCSPLEAPDLVAQELARLVKAGFPEPEAVEAAAS